jgi:hypothetical protein
LNWLELTRKKIDEQGWIEINRSPIKCKIQEIPCSFRFSGSSTLIPLETFKMLWDNNVHRKWMDQVKLNVKENHHLLNEENY